MKKMWWAILCFGLALALGAMGWESRRQGAALASWRAHPAKVELQTLEAVTAGHQPNPKSSHHRFTVRYSYEVDGRAFQGEDSLSQSVEDWTPWTEPYAQGKQIEIRLNPADPSQSRAFVPPTTLASALLVGAGLLALGGVALLGLALKGA
jgi:hypothetical protein